jgi:hypothetical protein
MDANRVETETFLLTLLSRLEAIRGVVVLTVEPDGRYVNHVANFTEEPWATMVGNLELIQHDIMSNRLEWAQTTHDGSEIETEDS